jgi:biotin carboxylase
MTYYNYKYLALTYDTHSLQDILDSSIDLKQIIVILPFSLYKKHSLKLASVGKVIKVKNYLNSGDIETIAYKEFHKNPYQYIIATHEIDILRAARLRELLQLPGQSYKSAVAFRQKTVMKEILKQKGIQGIPLFQSIKSPADVIDFMNKNTFPVVIKPDLGTGSEGVKILKNKDDVFSYLKQSSIFQVNQPVDMQVEEFINGKMYHINGFVLNGELIGCWPSVYPHQSIGMVDGKFASSYLLHSTNPLVARLNTYTQQILKALPTPLHTPFHLEVFINEADEIIFCEIASRIGGKGVRQSWVESFNFSLSNLFVQAQAGEVDSFILASFSDHPQCLTGEIWFPTQPGKLKNIEMECPFPWIKDYQTFYKKGDVIHQKAKNINDCLCGISLLTADTEEEMQSHLENLREWIQETVKWDLN